jgi:hypothetical protein
MPLDLSRWSAGEIAAVATCLAAAVAAVASFIVATVSTWSARRLAREAARREFRLTVARPYLEYVDRLIIVHGEFLEAAPDIAASLSRESTLSDSEKEAALKLKARLDEMVATLSESKTFHKSAGLMSLVLSDQRVVDLFHAWLVKHSAVVRLVVTDKFSTSLEDRSKMERAASEAFSAAVKFRMAIEESIFGNRGWLRRGSYYVWSKARTAIRKVKPKK